MCATVESFRSRNFGGRLSQKLRKPCTRKGATMQQTTFVLFWYFSLCLCTVVFDTLCTPTLLHPSTCALLRFDTKSFAPYHVHTRALNSTLLHASLLRLYGFPTFKLTLLQCCTFALVLMYASTFYLWTLAHVWIIVFIHFYTLHCFNSTLFTFVRTQFHAEPPILVHSTTITCLHGYVVAHLRLFSLALLHS